MLRCPRLGVLLEFAKENQVFRALLHFVHSEQEIFARHALQARDLDTTLNRSACFAFVRGRLPERICGEADEAPPS